MLLKKLRQAANRHVYEKGHTERKISAMEAYASDLKENYESIIRQTEVGYEQEKPDEEDELRK